MYLFLPRRGKGLATHSLVRMPSGYWQAELAANRWITLDSETAKRLDPIYGQWISKLAVEDIEHWEVEIPSK